MRPHGWFLLRLKRLGAFILIVRTAQPARSMQPGCSPQRRIGALDVSFLARSQGRLHDMLVYDSQAGLEQ